jgi:SulP family sulfate permease
LAPKLFTVFKEGYRWVDLRHDSIAGLTVAIVALPLSLALAIASGATPDKGLITAVVAGFLIAALGGSRVQIGGPTGAFVVVVFDVIAKHGYDGLLLATAMAGIFLVIAGLARLGSWIKYIPQPVLTGFTAGIAVVIFSTQIRDLLGLTLESVPADFVAKWSAYIRVLPSTNVAAVGISTVSLLIIVGLRIYAPRAPGFLLAVVVAALVASLLHLNVPTIGSRFGVLPAMLPQPALPELSWLQAKAVLPSAITIAFLAGVESLLSAMIADGMTGRRHRSNCELIAQGVANMASALFGGLPATGAIARTATNVRAGARSPVAGMLHAVFLLIFLMLLGPLIVAIPLASLAAVLLIVAWNMSEIDHVRLLLRGPAGDRIVLTLTFLLTVLVDLSVAIAVGVALAALMFMHQMAEVSAIRNRLVLDEREEDDPRTLADTARQRVLLPAGVELFELRGPLFFGVAEHVLDLLHRAGPQPKAYILDLREVPLVDASGASAVRVFLQRCHRRSIAVTLVGIRPSVAATLRQMQALPAEGVADVASIEAAISHLSTQVDRDTSAGDGHAS